MTSRFKKVSKKEYEAFISSYPNELDRNVVLFCEPPMENYNDFTDGKIWPESMVAKRFLEHDREDGEFYILENGVEL